MQQELVNYKIVIIGCPAVGKTSIASRFVHDSFDEDTQVTRGVQLRKKKMQIDGRNITVTLWDTVGQERFKALSKIYYKSANAALIVYDITDAHSFKEVSSWRDLLTETIDVSDVVVAIVGNKLDLAGSRVVPGAAAAQQYKGWELWQVSAKTGENISAMFEDVIRSTIEKTDKARKEEEVEYRQSACYDSFRESVRGRGGSEIQIEGEAGAEGKKTVEVEGEQIYQEQPPQRVSNMIANLQLREEQIAIEERSQRVPSLVLDRPARLTLNNQEMSQHEQANQLNRQKHCCSS